MDCVRFGEVIQRYVDRELGVSEVLEFQRHLSFCPACAAELDELSTVRSALAGIGGVAVTVPVGFADRVCTAATALPTPSPVERALSALSGGILPGRLPRRVRHLVYWVLVILAVAVGWQRYHERKTRGLV
jgi:anti-sigma factor RsiW